MPDSVQVNADLNFTQGSLRKGASQIKSAMSKIAIPVSVTITKKSIADSHKQVKTYFATKDVYINIALSKSSLASARKQLQAALSAVSIPQISLKPGVSRQINSLVASLNRLQSAGPSRSAASPVGAVSGGPRQSAPSRGGSRNSILPLGQLSGDASEFSKSMDAATARVFAFGATAVVLSSVTQSFRALVVSTIEVEKRLTEIQSIFNESDESFASFRDTIFSVASNTGQTFETVADGAAELARQGLSAAETAERLNAALILTRTTGIDAEDSVKSLTAVINGFSSANLNANEIVNKVVAVDTAFAVSAKDLTDGFARAGSTAEDAGVSFDQLLGLITALQQKTSRGGAVIGNGLKTIFTRISRGSVIQDLKELGVQINESQNGIEKLQAIGAAFEAASSDPVKQSKIKELAAGGFQINLISAALKDLNSEQSIFTDATNKSKQASTEAFDRNREQNETIAAQLNGLVASLTNLSEKVGQVSFAPLLKGFLKNSKEISDSLSSSLNPDAGYTFTKSFFDGIGAFIQGPGAVLVTAGLIKIFATVSGFAKQGLKEILSINIGNKETLAIQNRITTALQNNQRINEKVNSKTTSDNRRRQLTLALINREVAAEKNRLKVLESITNELRKQGAYLNADGSIGFDKSRVAKFARKGRDILSNPVTGVVGSVVGAAAVSSLKKNDPKALEVTGLNKKIEELRESLSLLNEETDAERIKAVNKELKKLESSSLDASTASELFQEKIERLAVAAGVAIAALQGGGKLGAVAAAAAIGYAIGDNIIKPIVEADQKVQENRFNPTADLASFEDENKKLIKEFERLARVTGLLTEEFTIASMKFQSELNTRTESQSLFDKTQFGGIGSNIALNKGLNDLLSNSESESVREFARRDSENLQRAEVTLGLAEIIEEMASIAQAEANKRVADLGFSSTSKIGEDSLVKTFEQPLQSVLASLNLERFGNTTLGNKLSDKTVSADLSTEEGIKSFATGLIKDLKPFEANSVAQNAIKVAEDALKQGSAQKESETLLKTSENLRTLLDSAQNIQSPEDLNKILTKFNEIASTGLIPEDKIESFKKALIEGSGSFAEIQRNAIIEQAKEDKEKLEKQKEINKKFIEDLKSAFESNTESVRLLREENLGGSISSSGLKDAFSKELSETLDKLGATSEEKSKVISSVGSDPKFSSEILGIAGRQLVGDIQKLRDSGANTRFSKEQQEILKAQQSNSNLRQFTENSSILGPGSGIGRSSVAAPLLESERIFKTAKSLEDLEKALVLAEKAQSGIRSLKVDPNGQGGEDLARVSIGAAQQIKLVRDVIASIPLGGNYSSAKKVEGGLDDQIINTVEGEKQSLSSLNEFVNNVGTTISTVAEAYTKTMGEISLSATQANQENARSVAEFAQSVRDLGRLSNQTESAIESIIKMREASEDVAEGMVAAKDKIQLEFDGFADIGAAGEQFKKVLTDIVAAYNAIKPGSGPSPSGGPIGEGF